MYKSEESLFFFLVRFQNRIILQEKTFVHQVSSHLFYLTKKAFSKLKSSFCLMKNDQSGGWSFLLLLETNGRKLINSLSRKPLSVNELLKISDENDKNKNKWTNEINRLIDKLFTLKRFRWFLFEEILRSEEIFYFILFLCWRDQPTRFPMNHLFSLLDDKTFWSSRTNSKIIRRWKTRVEDFFETFPIENARSIYR